MEITLHYISEFLDVRLYWYLRDFLGDKCQTTVKFYPFADTLEYEFPH